MQIRQPVRHQAIDFFGHRPIKRAQTGFDMRELEVLFLGGDRTRTRRIDIANDDNPIGAPISHNALKTQSSCDRLAPHEYLSPPRDSHWARVSPGHRRTKTTWTRRNAGPCAPEKCSSSLPRPTPNLLVMPIDRLGERTNLHEIGTRPNNRHDSERLQCFKPSRFERLFPSNRPSHCAYPQRARSRRQRVRSRQHHDRSQ